MIALGGLGAAAANEVEAATDSKLAGNVVGLGIDFVNPAADIVAVEELLEEIGIDIIEEVYEVDLDVEMETDIFFDYEPIDPEVD